MTISRQTLERLSKMIKVTRINGTDLVVNADLIEFVEATPDTIISLTTGKKIVVKDTIDEVIEKVASFRRFSSPQSTLIAQMKETVKETT
jgi:flagellar protein FlbD